jgi:beta-lactamase class A
VIAEPGDAESTTLYSRNCDTPFIAASLYKLILIADFYRAREDGSISLEQPITLLPEYFGEAGAVPEGDSYFDVTAVWAEVTIHEAIFAAGAYSSNVAARALLALTDMASLEATIRTLGLRQTRLFLEREKAQTWLESSTGSDDRPADADTARRFILQAAQEGPVNLTTPCDMARYFALLSRGELVSPAASAEISAILAQQAVDDRFPVLLPVGTELIHKTGNLDFVVHDAGIIDGAQGPVILIAMTESTPDEMLPTAIIQRLALIAYGDFDVPPIDESTTTGGAIPPPPAVPPGGAGD